MAFRGRGRGRGRGGRGGFDTRQAKHEEYILFPEDVNLPSLPSADSLSIEEKELVKRKLTLAYFWKGSCYHLEDSRNSRKQDVEIERFSDRFKNKMQEKREALASYLKLTPSNFPSELIQGSKRVKLDHKKLRWDRDPDEKWLDMLEKHEEKHKGKDEDGKEKKDEDEEEEAEEQAEEESSDDDYNQNVDFDDDEDDLNMEEEEYEEAYE